MKMILSWMMMVSYFFCPGSAYAQSRSTDEQIRDLKKIIHPTVHFPKLPDEMTEGALGCLCEGITAADTKVRPPLNCDLKGTRDELKLLPKDWGLKATGADLLRDEPLLKSLKYENTLGIVDSGLKLRG